MITTLDYHTCGEPLRIIRSGLPNISGDSMLEKRRTMQTEHDHVRKLVMLEPRGHSDMYGAVITEPVEKGSDCGVLFLHNEGYSTMCGHGIIAMVTAAVEHDLFRIKDTSNIRIDSPAGLIKAQANLSDGKVESVSFLNVPSFVLKTIPDFPVNGRLVDVTVAYGGAFYAYVDADQAGLELEPRNVAQLISMGRDLKSSVAQAVEISHPEGGEELNFLYGVIFFKSHQQPGHSRNVCIFANGELDRSPTGTGVSGRAAIHYADGDIGIGDCLTIDSIIGTAFTVECVGQVRTGNVPALVTRVTGSAYMMGENKFVLDTRDPLQAGFLIR